MTSLPKTFIPKSLHLLVHPLFGADPHVHYGLPDPLSLQQADVLQSRYIQAAARIGPQGILIALFHGSTSSFSKIQNESGFAQRLTTFRETLKNRLGPRYFELEKAMMVYDPALFERLELGKSGVEIPRDIRWQAYGETLGECVDNAALTFCHSFTLSRFPTIPVSRTDACFLWDEPAYQSQQLGLVLNARSEGLRLVFPKTAKPKA